MQKVGVRELKEQTSQILRRLRESGESFEVTYRGRVIARLVPTIEPAVEHSPAEALREEWDRLSKEISARWPKGLSAVDAVREERRDI
jgi:antitoxin (DNA-binding transcriptional repressor) of toxin-antitoxin stability system